MLPEEITKLVETCSKKFEPFYETPLSSDEVSSSISRESFRSCRTLCPIIEEASQFLSHDAKLKLFDSSVNANKSLEQEFGLQLAWHVYNDLSKRGTCIYNLEQLARDLIGTYWHGSWSESYLAFGQAFLFFYLIDPVWQKASENERLEIERILMNPYFYPSRINPAELTNKQEKVFDSSRLQNITLGERFDNFCSLSIIKLCINFTQNNLQKVDTASSSSTESFLDANSSSVSPGYHS